MCDEITVGDYVRDIIANEEGYIRLMLADGTVILDCYDDRDSYFFVVPPNHELFRSIDECRPQL